LPAAEEQWFLHFCEIILERSLEKKMSFKNES
jgi:hypothetical protein